MELKISSFKTDNQEKFVAVRKIREVVFIKEQKVEERDEFDEFEDDCIHYIMSLGEKPIGTARWREINGKVKLERFAVLKEARGKKYGDQLLAAVLNDAQKLDKRIYLHAQLKAIPFYGRRGFVKVGELFLECNIEHYEMEWQS